MTSTTRRKRKAERLDPVDAELIKETLRSPGWQLIKQGLLNMIRKKTDDLVRPQNEVETAALRGAIEALRSVLSVPEILVREGQRNGQI